MAGLERLVERETLQEALELMTGFELLLAAGRAAGLSNRELAERLEIKPSTVSYYLAQARRRIMAEVPELRVTLSGRRWQEDDEEEEVQEAPEEQDGWGLEEAAERLGVTPELVAMWIQEGKVESAYRTGKEWRVEMGD